MAQHYQQNTSPPSYPQSNAPYSHALPTASPERPHSRSSTPKSRRYGNLQEAAAAVRSGQSPLSTSSNSSPTKGSSFRRQPNHFPSATKQYSVNGPVVSSPAISAPFSLNKKSYTSIKRTGEANSIPVKHHQSPRVISRSGVDYNGAFAFDGDDGADLGVPMMGRRRDVSGKVAEEGRGGMGWEGSGIVQRKVSGVAQAY